MLFWTYAAIALASAPVLPEVPDDVRTIDWEEIDATAQMRCRAIRTRGDFAAVIGARIYVASQISASFADAAENDLPRVASQLREAMISINEGPAAVPTLFEIEDLRRRLRARASDLALDVARITPEIIPYANEPGRRLRARDRRAAIDGCADHMVAIVRTVSEHRLWAETERDRLQASLDDLFGRYPQALAPPTAPPQRAIVVRDPEITVEREPERAPVKPLEEPPPVPVPHGYGPHP